MKLLFYDENSIEDRILREAILDNASDIHFEPFEDEVIVRFRINGSMVIYMNLKVEEYNLVLSRLKIQAQMDITEKKRAQDGKVKFIINKKVYNCRLSTMPVIFGEKLVIRIMYDEKFNSSLDGLNFSSSQLIKIQKIINLNSGILIINGPTGSGKSTTIYSILNIIKGDKINIITLEDPVEVQIKGINQIELNEKKGITFCEGLKGCLRQDPDVLMIGEIRDEETAKIAIRAAITGHKVYSTIHAKSPREVYFRLIDMGVESYLLKEAVKGIISQRLVNILCNKCKQKYCKVNYKGTEVTLYKKSGCNLCKGNGYISRRMISTVIYIDSEIKERLTGLVEDKSLLNNFEMLSSLNELVLQGKIDCFDYINFIEEEELNEGKLREFIINY